MAITAITPNAHTVQRRKPVKRVEFLTFREQGKKMSIKGLEISKMLTLSTAHITKETSCWLARNIEKSDCPITVINYEYGWIIPVTEEDYDHTSEIPEDIRVIQLFCRDNDIDFLKLDRDGEATNLFDTFEW